MELGAAASDFDALTGTSKRPALLPTFLGRPETPGHTNGSPTVPSDCCIFAGSILPGSNRLGAQGTYDCEMRESPYGRTGLKLHAHLGTALCCLPADCENLLDAYSYPSRFRSQICCLTWKVHLHRGMTHPDPFPRNADRRPAPNDQLPCGNLQLPRRVLQRMPNHHQTQSRRQVSVNVIS